jgi:hypothetical protein
LAPVTEHDLSRLIDAHDVEAIAALPASEIDGLLRGIVRDVSETGRDFDADRLVSLGNTLQLAGWSRADRALVGELARRPTERALDAVGAILMGLWNGPADPEALATLVAVERELKPVDPSAVHSFRVAVEKGRKSG